MATRERCSFAASAGSPVTGQNAVIKVCGVRSAGDAEMVLEVALHEMGLAPENLRLGMILWPNSRRSVKPIAEEGALISSLALNAGVQPVGVFVDETAAQMEEACRDAKLTTAQLHGPASRRNGYHLDSTIERILVVDVKKDGTLVEEETDDSQAILSFGGTPPWRIFDAKGGGTGKPFDWGRFESIIEGQDRWMLAGGLNPKNVSEAVRRFRPPGIDVASGVTTEDGVTKDKNRLRSFIYEALNAYECK